MQKRLLLFSLLILIFFACEREGNLLVQEIPEPNESVVVEERSNYIEHYFKGVSVLDTIGLALVPENLSFIYVTNGYNISYECSRDAMDNVNGLSTGLTLGDVSNPLGYAFLLIASFNDQGEVVEPSIIYSDPLASSNHFYRNELVPCPDPMTTDLSVELIELSDERVIGNISGLVMSRNAVGIPCEEIVYDTAQVDIFFRLPRTFCD